MPLNITVEMRKVGVYIAKLQGRLDSGTYMFLEERLAPFLDPSTKGIILDMGELEYISSAGVRVVFKTRKFLESQNGSFIMTHLKPQIEKVFEIINALPSMNIFRSVEEADQYLDLMQKKEIRRQKEQRP
ncbi:MAG: STAS domain-containing protein [Pseudomonadota bacterium]